MVGVRSSHVDYVDVGVGDEVFVVAVGGAGLWDAEGRDELGCFVFGRGGRDGDDLVGDVGGIAGFGVFEEIADESCGLVRL